MIFICIITATALNPAGADEKTDCKEYKEKLHEAMDSCDLDSFLALKELSGGMGADCNEDIVNEILGQYFTKCFQPHLTTAIVNCDLDMLLKEEEIINSQLDDLPAYTVMREMHRHSKCSEFSERCLQNMLDEALAEEDWSKILEVERIVQSNAIKICSNHSKLTAMIKNTKGDYYRQWIPEKLTRTIDKQDLEKIYSLETFTFEGMKDSPDFQKMREEFLNLKCSNQDRILQVILAEAVVNCDLNQIRQTENLMTKKWKKNCPDYDYDAMKENFHLTKLAYFEKCFDDTLETIISDCDLGRILDMEREAGNIEEAGVLDDVSDGKCGELEECFIEDFRHTINTCNHDRLRLLGTIIKSRFFNECDDHDDLLEILREQKQAFAGKCPSSKADNKGKKRPANRR